LKLVLSILEIERGGDQMDKLYKLLIIQLNKLAARSALS